MEIQPHGLTNDSSSNKELEVPSGAMPTILELYEIYREYAKHEDNLIHQRMTWLLTIHGFLYATYGFTLQKKMEINEKLIVDNITIDSKLHTDFNQVLSQINNFLIILSLVGITISFFAFLSVRAAKTSINNIRDIANSSLNMDNRPRDGIGFNIGKQFRLPDIAGGGLRFADKFGVSASVTIPWILIGSWLFSLLIMFKQQIMLLFNL